MLRTVLALLAVSLVVLPGSALGDTPTLTAIVGTNDGFDITLNDPEGNKVSRILPGTYTIVVDDRSTIHNFHLASNPIRPSTSAPTSSSSGSSRYGHVSQPHLVCLRVRAALADHERLVPGYRHARRTSSPTTSTQTEGREADCIGVGVGSRTSEPIVGSKRPWRIVVTDRSKKANFHLLGKGVDRRTGVKFRGWQAGACAAPGTYRYGSDARPLTRKLRVVRLPA